MQTLQEMERKLKNTGDLHTVVRTMKSLAAVNIRQYEEANRSLKEYFRTVELGLRAVLPSHPLMNSRQKPLKTLFLVFGSDQGMAGRFNEAIIEYVHNVLRGQNLKGSQRQFWVFGSKAQSLMEESFGRLDQTLGLPTSVESIVSRVQQVLLLLAGHLEKQAGFRLILFHNSPSGGASYQQTRINLLPPDNLWLQDLGGRDWPGRQLPFYTLPREKLFRALIGEYLFVALFRGFAASLAAENAARLASMQRAEKNIEEALGELTKKFHSMRQNVISEELFDVISGFEALS